VLRVKESKTWFFGFYYHFKLREKLTVMFSMEGPADQASGTDFGGKRGRN
jgi:hypothetical protein